MVRVDISKIIDDMGASQPFSIVVTTKEIGEENPWVHGEISVTGQIVNVGTAFRLIADITATATLECSRCLKLFEQPVNFQLEEELDSVAFGFTDEQINIAEPIRAALIFQEPMQPLCTDNCKGLCSYCGVDRNQVKCDCNKKNLDPRLAALGQLLEK